jgi:5S rRNA maturation endonuclease (ribonuclease M5)
MNNLLQSAENAARHFAKKPLAQGYQFEALHTYRDSKGAPIYFRVRLKNPTTGDKWIRPMHCTQSGKFLLKEPVFLQGKPLYHLPELIQNLDKTIWIVEGEKCADALINQGLMATTSGGVDSIATTDWSPLHNRNIIIWRDNDVAGLRYAQKLTLQLQKIDCHIQWVDVSQLQLPEKSDCVDWLNQNIKAHQTTIESLPMISTNDGNHSPQSSINHTSLFRMTDK